MHRRRLVTDISRVMCADSHALKSMHLRSQIQGGFSALQICWHRHVFVHNAPLIIVLAEASGPSKPALATVPTLEHAARSIEAVRKCNLASDCNLQIADFVIDATFVRCEQCSPVLFEDFTASMLSNRKNPMTVYLNRRTF
jgi:hypothetical protein